MSPAKLSETLLRDCGCARVGYALVLCQYDAPIPYELTPRGQREARRMRQWDALFETLEQRGADSPASRAARKAWGTRRAKQARS